MAATLASAKNVTQPLLIFCHKAEECSTLKIKGTHTKDHTRYHGKNYFERSVSNGTKHATLAKSGQKETNQFL